MGKSSAEFADGRAKRDKARPWLMLAVFGGCALVVAGFFVGASLLRGHGAEHNRGRAAGATIVELDSGMQVIALVDDSGEQTPQRGNHHPLYRLATIDLATGKKQRTRIFEGYVLCWNAAHNRLWCHIDHVGTNLINATTLETLGNAEELVATAMHTKPLVADSDVGVVDGGLVIRLNDGRNARIDAGTMSVTEVSEAKNFGLPSRDHCALKTRLKDRRFSDGTRQAIVTGPEDNKAEPTATAPRFLQPEFLVTQDPNLILVLHRATLDKENLVLSRVDGERIAWSIDTGPCELTVLDGKTLILASKDTSKRIVALDVDSGTPRWSFAF